LTPFSLGDAVADWPPNELGLNNASIKLPESPWTYENGALNPYLQPQRPRLRKAGQQPFSSSVPPYHPDFQKEQEEFSPDEYEERPPRIRRGSEGYEIQPIDREQLFQRYIEEQMTADGRYHVYERESSVKTDSDDEDVPLAYINRQFNVQA
jgi:palmitoyltransferase